MLAKVNKTTCFFHSNITSHVSQNETCIFHYTLYNYNEPLFNPVFVTKTLFLFCHKTLNQ